MKWLLVFLLGAFAGANVTYYLVKRDHAPGAAREADVPAPPVSADARTDGRSGVALQAQGRGGTVAPGTVPGVRAPTAADASRIAASAARDATALLPAGSLMVPVQGVQPAQLVDTYAQSRGEGRLHEALDIMAARGTPVLAAADGTIAKLFNSERGGLTVYQFNDARTIAYYYAHLDRYAPGLAEGQRLRRGDRIGDVGSSGNADPAGPHLHFAVFKLGPDAKWWEGEAVNPYPLLVKP